MSKKSQQLAQTDEQNKHIKKEENKPQDVNMTMKSDTLARILEDEGKKRMLIQKYIQERLVEGTDYGTIKMGGRDSKPCLFKPGSEKICSLLHLKPEFHIDKDLLPIVGEGVIPYVCQLVNRHTGVIEGEGRGSCSIREKGNNVNVAVKIAEKRAQVDAVLRVAALSDQFTQDLEDMSTMPAPLAEAEPANRNQAHKATTPVTPRVKEKSAIDRCRDGMDKLGLAEEEQDLLLAAFEDEPEALLRNLTSLYKAPERDKAKDLLLQVAEGMVGGA